jgi:hypothetical protein
MELDYFCCPGVSAIGSISVLLLLSLCDRLPVTLLCRTTRKKRFLLGSQMLSGAIGLWIESCPLSMQQVKIPNALVEISLAFLKSRGIR